MKTGKFVDRVVIDIIQDEDYREMQIEYGIAFVLAHAEKHHAEYALAIKKVLVR